MMNFDIFNMYNHDVKQKDDVQHLIYEAVKYLTIHYENEDNVLHEFDEECTIFYQIDICEDDIKAEMEETFSQTLFKLIKQQGVSETDCYKNANIDRRLFSKIRSNDDYKPKKSTVFALIIGLKLNLDDAKKLLGSAGYSISHGIKSDVIMEFVIKNQVYDINKVNEILYSLNCPII